MAGKKRKGKTGDTSRSGNGWTLVLVLLIAVGLSVPITRYYMKKASGASYKKMSIQKLANHINKSLVQDQNFGVRISWRKTYEAVLSNQFRSAHRKIDEGDLLTRATGDCQQAMGILQDKLGDATGLAPSLARLKEMLDDGDAKNRLKAAKALSQNPDKAKKAVPELAEALTDSHYPVVRESLQAFSNLNAKDLRPAAKPMAEMLIQAPHVRGKYKDDWLKGASQASLILGRMGKDAHKAVPVLAEALTNDPDLAVQENAGWLLKKLDPKTYKEIVGNQPK